MSDRQPNGASAWVDAMREGDQPSAREDTTTPTLGERWLTQAARIAGGALTGDARRERRERRAAERSLSKRLRRREGKDEPRKPRTADELSIKAVIGNVVVDRSEVYAWFVLSPVSHGFSPMQEIEASIVRDAESLGALVGRRLHVRVTSRPYSVAQWARDTFTDAAAHSTPNGAFEEYLTRQQEHMSSGSFSEKWAYLGVRVSTFRRNPFDPFKEARSVLPDVTKLAGMLATSSLAARPATTQDMEWLLRRSVALGVPMAQVGVAADYAEDDVTALEASAYWTAEPLAGHITVNAKPAGIAGPVQREVTVLSLGRLSDQEIPQRMQTGWMQRSDRLPFPVEWSAVVDVRPEEKTRSWLRGRAATIEDQMKHYGEEHGMKPPASLARQDAMAASVVEELDSDHGGRALRTEGWYRMAVAAPDVETLRKRVLAVKQQFGTKVELVEDANQYAQAREFIPGEKLSTRSHKRHMSVVTLAAAIPHGTAEVGDRAGVAIGSTAGAARRSVAWHTHWDMERRGLSGLCVIAAGLGGGKSTLLGWIVYQSVMAGVQWSVLDPSDRLGRLCGLPELRDVSRYINLMNGQPGDLNPYWVVAEPRREHYDTVAEWEQEVSSAKSTRRALMEDVAYNVLRPEFRTEDTAHVLTRAIYSFPATRETSSRRLLDALDAIANGEAEQDLGESGRKQARTLRILFEEVALTPKGKLIFPAVDAEVHVTDDDDKLLTIYTLNGLSIPNDEAIASGSVSGDQRLSLSIMALAASLVRSRIYKGDPNRRKGIGIDEGKQLAATDVGRDLQVKIATDTRKFNVRALLVSQNVTHFEIDGDGSGSLGNLIGASFIGATKDDDAAAAALKVLRVPAGEGYENVLKSLRPPADKRREMQHDEDGTLRTASKGDETPRHFVFSDGTTIERVVVNLDAHPHVKAALDTNPNSTASIEAAGPRARLRRERRDGDSDAGEQVA